MNAVLRLGDPARAFWLTRSVARAMNISLSEAMADGRLSADHYTQMVTRCRTCACTEHCELWLARSAKGADTAPEVCANADTYNRLKR